MRRTFERVQSMRRKSGGAEGIEQQSSGSDPAPARLGSQDEGPFAPSAESPGAKTRAATGGAKSLVKRSVLATRRGNGARSGAKAVPAATADKTRPGKLATAIHTADRKQKIEERIAAASEELIAGITESASAAEELRRAMEQIASGAEEAASASQETLSVAASTATGLAQARQRAEAAQRRTEALQAILSESSNQIGTWANNIKRNGERQTASISVIEQLRQSAASIAEITKTVGHISDETNLLALNAAIEAARAGDHGRGFAVVADEVRALAETSEKSARQAQNLAASIEDRVKSVAAMIKTAADAAAVEVEKSQTVILALGDLRKEVGALTEASQTIVGATREAEVAAGEAQKGAEMISSAAEEQAAAASQALRSVVEQTSALEESQTATRSLAATANSLELSKGTGSADQLAAAAEQLSTTVRELSGASAQIMVAVDQISRGAQQQASATQQSSAALAQIEKVARSAMENAAGALDRAKQMSGMLTEIRSTVSALSAGLARSLNATGESLGLIAGIEAITRNVEKIVDGIGMVSIQTNMLAVNGSVEAARAGDSGKGFALVSKDIRGLARDSRENAETIKDTVRGIQEQMAAVRRELQQIVAAADTENQRNASVLTGLAAVETEMTEVSTNNQQILANAEAILVSVKEAARGAQEVASVAEEAGSAAAEAAAAAKEQARGAEDLAAAIEEIASLADDIQRRNG